MNPAARVRGVRTDVRRSRCVTLKRIEQSHAYRSLRLSTSYAIKLGINGVGCSMEERRSRHSFLGSTAARRKDERPG